MQCRGRQGGVVRPSLPGSSTPPRRYKYSVGLIPDKPLSPVSIPQDPRDLTSRHARSPSHRGACPTPALLPPGSSSRASPPLPRIDGVRVLRRAGALRRRFPPLRLPGVRASSLPFPPLALLIAGRVVPSPVFGRSGAASAEPEGEHGLRAP
jgi:hypothetical protein